MPGSVEGQYTTFERRMGQLQKASQVFQRNVETLSGINKSLVGFHTVFSEFIVGIQTASARLEALPPSSPLMPKSENLADVALKREVVPKRVEVVDVSNSHVAKKPKRSSKKTKVTEKEPELCGRAKVLHELKGMIPQKFHTEGHLKQLYQVLKAVVKKENEDGATVAKLAADTGLGRVQLEEYLSVLVKCSQLLKMRTKGLKFVGNSGNLIEICGCREEQE